MIDFKEKIAVLLEAQTEGISIDDIRAMIEIPADSKLGDYAFPCFRLAKVMRKAPALIAAGKRFVFEGGKRKRICEFFPGKRGVCKGSCGSC